MTIVYTKNNKICPVLARRLFLMHIFNPWNAYKTSDGFILMGNGADVPAIEINERTVDFAADPMGNKALGITPR